MSAYEGEIISLFHHYSTACQLKTQWQAATLHEETKQIKKKKRHGELKHAL